jgi:hypothetical protein
MDSFKDEKDNEAFNAVVKYLRDMVKARGVGLGAGGLPSIKLVDKDMCGGEVADAINRAFRRIFD